jgi:hypothetical protein
MKLVYCRAAAIAEQSKAKAMKKVHRREEKIKEQFLISISLSCLKKVQKSRTNESKQ